METSRSDRPVSLRSGGTGLSISICPRLSRLLVFSTRAVRRVAVNVRPNSLAARDLTSAYEYAYMRCVWCEYVPMRMDPLGTFVGLGGIVAALAVPPGSPRTRSKYALLAGTAILIAGYGIKVSGGEPDIPFGMGLLVAGIAGVAVGVLGLILFSEKSPPAK